MRCLPEMDARHMDNDSFPMNSNVQTILQSLRSKIFSAKIKTSSRVVWNNFKLNFRVYLFEPREKFPLFLKSEKTIEQFRSKDEKNDAEESSILNTH